MCYRDNDFLGDFDRNWDHHHHHHHHRGNRFSCDCREVRGRRHDRDRYCDCRDCRRRRRREYFCRCR